MLHELLSNKSLTYIDKNKVDQSQFKTLEGIRVRKMQNQSKMEKIL